MTDVCSDRGIAQSEDHDTVTTRCGEEGVTIDTRRGYVLSMEKYGGAGTYGLSDAGSKRRDIAQGEDDDTVAA